MGKYETKIPEIKERIIKAVNPEKIILFGSYAWGEPKEDSDVDLFIVKNSEKKKADRAKEVREAISSSGVPVDILVYTPEEVNNSINKNRNLFIEDIVRNGKVIFEKPGNKLTITLPARPLTVLN